MDGFLLPSLGGAALGVAAAFAVGCVAIRRERARVGEQVHQRVAAILSHELRTPLTAVLGLAQTVRLRGDGLAPDVRGDCLADIERQARRLARLVDDLLAAARTAPPGRRGEADLDDVLDVVLAGIEAEAPGSRARVRRCGTGGLRLALTSADAVHALGNVLGNALKFGLPGTTVEVRARRDGRIVQVEVSNESDAPVPPGAAAFDRFVQGDSSDTRRYQGAGLGLAVVRDLVEAAGGAVALDVRAPVVTTRLALPAGG